MSLIFATFAILSLGLLLWQWLAAFRFPLHQPAQTFSFQPALTLLKPLKGCDQTTESCLRSWLQQDYQGPVHILFGVASAEDPVCPVVRSLLQQFPASDAQFVICGPLAGPNLKVSKLAQLEKSAKHDLLVISDADVRVPLDFLKNLVVPLQQEEVGLVNCFYRLANPSTLAMQWEALAVNADFWSQVLQAQTIKRLDFAMGAVMAVRQPLLNQIGGFEALVDCLADDYQLGHRIAQRGHRIALSPLVVECCSAPMNWRQVWKHQLRWARTIRVCQPVPYFFSILNNATLWPLVWLAVCPMKKTAIFAVGALLVRAAVALDLQSRLTRAAPRLRSAWLIPIKDLLQTLLWMLAFLGNKIEWRGQQLQLRRDGTLVKQGTVDG